MPWQVGPELVLGHQISSSSSASFSSSWHQCRHPDPGRWNETELDFQTSIPAHYRISFSVSTGFYFRNNNHLD